MMSTVRVLFVGREHGYSERVDVALSMLSKGEFELHRASEINAACKTLREGDFDLVVLDLTLPGASGLEGFLRVMSERETVPIVCLASMEDDEPAIEAMRRGAQEYLYTEAVTTSQLSHAIHQSLERWRFIVMLQRQATYDEMTGLRNRHGFMRLAQYRFSLARRAKASLAMLFIDIDGLKKVNDGVGHAEGDNLINDTAEILKATLRETDIIGRIGGDEFCAVLGEDNNASSDLVVKRLQRAANVFNERNERSYKVALSIGIDRCDFTEPGAIITLEELIARADSAMYDLKRARKAAADGSVA